MMGYAQSQLQYNPTSDQQTLKLRIQKKSKISLMKHGLFIHSNIFMTWYPMGVSPLWYYAEPALLLQGNHAVAL